MWNIKTDIFITTSTDLGKGFLFLKQFGKKYFVIKRGSLSRADEKSYKKKLLEIIFTIFLILFDGIRFQ